MDVEVIDVEGMGHRAMVEPEDGDAEPNESGETNATENSAAYDETGIVEPYVGMEFDSEDVAKTFYDEYARRVGFSSKVSLSSRSQPDGTSITREFVCGREGLKRKHADSCDAMLKIELKDHDKWVVTKFVKEHSHSLLSPSKVHYLRPRRHFAGNAKTVTEAYQGVGVVPSGVMYVSMDGNRASAEKNRGARNTQPIESNRPVKNAASMNYAVRLSTRRRTLGKDSQNLLEAVQTAVAHVFPEARHCISKWHVLREGQEKLAHVCLANPNFQVELYNCINLTETIEEFESSWNSVLDKYDLRRNDWLQSLYNARAQWVPVYFRDSFFAAISPNLGYDGSFFDGYVNQQTTLPMFFRQYERALENWSEKETEADFDTLCTMPVLRTPSPMEKQAANLYTRKIFGKFQEELVETFVYTANRIEGDGAISTFRVAKFEDDNKAYIVTLNYPEMRANCSCQMFEYSGILCRHVLTVFTVTNVLTLPSHYIMKRWTRNAKSGPGTDERSVDIHGQESLTLRYNNLCREAIRYAEEGATAVETYQAALSALRDGGKKVALVKKNVAKVAPPSSQVSGASYDDRKISALASDTTPLLWPRQDEVLRRFNLNDAGAHAQSVADLNLPRMAPVSLHRDDGPPENMVVLPCLKSMTWVMENKNSTPGNRVAVINLKLQDYSRTPSAESEVKFQLSRVSLEPMLRSMAYISEQLSTPANKVAVINLKLQDTETTSGESEVKFQVSRDTLGAMLRSMAYIREQLSNAGENQPEPLPKKQRK
ncbi:hypothetical protein FEM48_Zijuj02G0014500 [Ziziphus jujuba var. spinosa]|uniref:Protein FAR1-RELATED SEQUENCE n=1 Tax=Ziziphus jujuba var. spinosa TaxID=714518 RepID=A0A978VST7_ZIZJJ|nr:hypothetical protein FEM48_Zijuj02G0014500 [Ziziphus jujuba var. spinosa]